MGYVAICNSLKSTSSPYTYSEYLKNGDINKLNDVIKSNLIALNNIIDYNIKNNVHFYRMSSKLIPLATKDDVVFDYIDKYIDLYIKIGNKINEFDMRVDFHPDQFTVLNSTKREVFENTVKILEYHYKVLCALNIKNKILVLHVGSGEFGKDNSIKRFINNFKKLPKYLQDTIVIENDDKIFTAEDTLYLANYLNIPMVLDYHHYKCNKSNLDLDAIFKTWKNEVPKVHFSSSKNTKEFRSHNDYIDSNEFIEFLENLKGYNNDIDIMIEAKKTDESLFKLVRELKYKTNYEFIDETSFYI